LAQWNGVSHEGWARTLKVLHVWNTAGVASVIAKFVDRVYKDESLVVTRREADKFGLTTYGRTYADGPFMFLLRAELMARHFDLVHVHSLDRLVPWLKRLYGKPVVVHYHGTDILGRWEEKSRRWRRADLVAYSTSNLSDGAPSRATHFPNPVDTDLFHPREGNMVKGSALSISYGMDEEAKRIAAERTLDLTLIERGSVPYTEMPAMLTKFEYYLDLRRPPGFTTPVKSLGKAALEALASGCKVVDWSGKILTELPEENKPEVVAQRWHTAYVELAKGEGTNK
jgi:glycosyltransferase involved in cell wall biosynthesis